MAELLPLNQFMTYCAIGMGAVQLIFALNFVGSLVLGRRAGRNPWHANTLEWSAPSPPGHGNFDFQPVVYHGPYEFSHPDTETDHFPQTVSQASEMKVEPKEEEPV